MGRLLIIALFLTPLLFSLKSYAVEMDGLVKSTKLSNERIVKYVQSGLSEYSDDLTIKACVKKLALDKSTTIYALFNYIMYLDIQQKIGDLSGKAKLDSTRKMIKVATYAKKAINYCNG